MSNLPEIKYAKSDGMSIAYSRWGEGDHVVVFTPPFISNIELMWDLEEWERALTWAGKQSQMILIDKRGVAYRIGSWYPQRSNRMLAMSWQ